MDNPTTESQKAELLRENYEDDSSDLSRNAHGYSQQWRLKEKKSCAKMATKPEQTNKLQCNVQVLTKREVFF